MSLKCQHKDGCFRPRPSRLMFHSKQEHVTSRRRSVTRLSFSGTWKIIQTVVVDGSRCRALLSSRHERTVVRMMCVLVLFAGPTAGCSAVLAIRRCCGHWSLVCAFNSVCAEEAGSKTKRKGKREKNTTRSGVQTVKNNRLVGK